MLGILITARLGSTRLPNKHLQQVKGRPIISYLLDRIIEGFDDEIQNRKVKVIIASSAEEMNLQFKQFNPLVDTFFGDIKNIPFRHLQAAYNYGLDTIVAVDGDDILCSVQSMKDVYELLKKGEGYAYTKGLPFGLNSFGYSTEFLSDALQRSDEKVLETGWGRIFDTTEAAEKTYPKIDEYEKKLRFTLDYEEDLNFLRTIIENLSDKIYTLTDAELVSYVLEQKLYRMNAGRVEEYWNNFKTQKEKYG